METQQCRPLREPKQRGNAFTMGTMEKAEKTLPEHEYVVGTLLQKENPTGFLREEAERRRDRRRMENFYYECLYDVLRNAGTNGANLPALNRLKTNIERLHSQRTKTILIDNPNADRLEGGQRTIYQIIQIEKRSTARISGVHEMKMVTSKHRLGALNKPLLHNLEPSTTQYRWTTNVYTIMQKLPGCNYRQYMGTT
jgi:hypothetical protein